MGSEDMLLQVECTYFFEENPYAMETKQSLAQRLGRTSHDLGPILEQLVSLTVLSRFGEGEDSIYRYQQPIMQEKLDDRWIKI